MDFSLREPNITEKITLNVWMKKSSTEADTAGPKKRDDFMTPPFGSMQRDEPHMADRVANLQSTLAFELRFGVVGRSSPGTPDQ